MNRVLLRTHSSPQSPRLAQTTRILDSGDENVEDLSPRYFISNRLTLPPSQSKSVLAVVTKCNVTARPTSFKRYPFFLFPGGRRKTLGGGLAGRRDALETTWGCHKAVMFWAAKNWPKRFGFNCIMMFHFTGYCAVLAGEWSWYWYV